MWGRSFIAISAIFAAFLALACNKTEAAETEVMLAVAASLRNVTPVLAKAYTDKHPGTKISATYGASLDLRKQIEGGAPIDAIVFAGAQPVDDLIQKGHAEGSSRTVLAQNRLVLIGPQGKKPLTFSSLTSLPVGEKIAVGDPGAVPAGQYARDYLKKIGSWDALQSRLVLGGDVAAVLAYARRGEVAAAIVYRTEARGIQDVVIWDEALEGAPRIEVVSAVISGGKAKEAAASFLNYVSSPEGQKVLAEFGFGRP